MTAAIAVRDLTVRYGAFTAVDRASFEVAPGEIFGFLGPNGAGKSSTIRVLVDLVRPDSGRAELLGRDVRAGGAALRREVGFLPGDLALFPELTGARTLDLFADLQGGRTARRDEALDTLGFPRAALDRRVRGYSTGMRQMLGIVQAFQHEPRVLILDEPSTGLDPLVRDAFLELVRGAARRGATVLFSSHVLAEVEACADRVALIDNGRIALVDTMRSLRASLPHRVTTRRRDAEPETFLHQGDLKPLLADLAARGDELVDVEIRHADLGEIFRSVVRGGAGAARS